MKKLSVLLAFLILSCSSSSEYLPEKFLDMSLTKKLTGSAASEYVNKLHFQNVAGVSNEIGFYEGTPEGSLKDAVQSGQTKAVIYITYYADEKSAEDDFQKMTAKISPGNSVFMLGSFIDKSGKKVYRTFGMGQTQYVFTHYNSLFWLSVETVGAEKFLEEYLNFLSKIK